MPDREPTLRVTLMPKDTNSPRIDLRRDHPQPHRPGRRHRRPARLRPAEVRHGRHGQGRLPPARLCRRPGQLLRRDDPRRPDVGDDQGRRRGGPPGHRGDGAGDRGRGRLCRDRAGRPPRAGDEDPVRRMTCRIRRFSSPGGRTAPIIIAPISTLSAARDRRSSSTFLPQRPAETTGAIREYLRPYGGILFPGGVDIEPRRYAALPHPNLGRVDPGLDEAQLALARVALADELPIFGICRGFSSWPSPSGRTSIRTCRPNVPDSRSGTTSRSRRTGSPIRSSSIRDSRLGGASLGKPRFKVNSRHHQAAKADPDAPTGSARFGSSPGPWTASSKAWRSRTAVLRRRPMAPRKPGRPSVRA